MPTTSEAPQWVLQRLIAVGGETGPRYEASLYGPTNSLLVSYFPVTDQFMVKPQGKIRPEFVNDSDATVRASLDSYHAEVLPRGFGGSEVGVGIPDFIVVKATEAKDNDRVLLVVEIKSSDRTAGDAAEQLGNYLAAFSHKNIAGTQEPLFNVLYGLLIVGKKVQLLTLPISGEVGISGLLAIDNGAVHAFLKNIATTNM
ncbi:hypothetical protein M378DRAFT_17159 [Amanita muscaria Koide BX008]|uniref:Uncharacterized protein n=1 Tax=Amanita muscaria (strain Koide BX008) TaxID=946122 RepID=A0A0C2WJL4_AMAMK|nr:hypothetical protein M378DRAFT_17159 [Amanita muscaria Koide BX008]